MRGQKDRPSSFSPVTSTNVGISLRNILTFSFNHFPNWHKISKPYLVPVPNYWTWTNNAPPKNWLFKKDVKELSWMSHRVIRFWFLLNFVFISALLDILASLSISHIFSSGFSGRRKPPASTFPKQLSNVIILIEFNLYKLYINYQIINTSAVNQAVFCYY